ncbi:UNKNOWN [Stylonychia lemnae]|uniref:Uncharacterized protein n=1 Tax=Stylonychia lemnae TaxID=5949 RepID=A0A078B5S5_STYLE|nr:UNKNOWN [Stylonychia lemnae]|eukprot:CDW89561.1 UNKNOWN [Stylonychia lemnae]
MPSQLQCLISRELYYKINAVLKFEDSKMQSNESQQKRLICLMCERQYDEKFLQQITNQFGSNQLICRYQ